MQIVNNVDEVGLLDMQKAAAYLSIKVSTLYALCMKRQITFIKIGRLNRFRMSDLNKWLDEHVQRGLGQ
jgi:excisionase family DNA binding protein